MFCHKCGSQSLDDAAFCQKCGVKLIKAETAQQAPAASALQASVQAAELKPVSSIYNVSLPEGISSINTN